MKPKLRKLFLLPLLGVMLMSGCDQKGIDRNTFNFSNEEFLAFPRYTGALIIKDRKQSFSISVEDMLFKNVLTKDNILAFDYGEAISKAYLNDHPSITFDDIASSLISFTSIDTNPKLNGFSISLGDKVINNPAFVIDKKVTIDESFIICTTPLSDPLKVELDEEEQQEYEENYLGQPQEPDLSVSDGKFLLEIMQHSLVLVAQIASGNSACAISEMFSLVSSITNKAFPSVSTQDLMDKLNKMDAKLDKITNMLDVNFNQLEKDVKAVEAKVDKVLLEQYTDRVNDFLQVESRNIEDDNRTMTLYLNQYLKQFVNSKQSLSFYVKQENDLFDYQPIMNEDPTLDQRLTVEIKDFTNSKEFLSKEKVVKDGFEEALLKDIEFAIKDMYVPSKIKSTKEDIAKIILGHIFELMIRKYFSIPEGEVISEKANKFNNDVLAYIKVISGREGTSVVDDYINKLKFTFNFGSEIKKASTGFLANLLHNLDSLAYTNMVALDIAEMDPTEFKAEYALSRKKIKATYEAIKQIDSSYCFTTENFVNGKFFKAEYVCGFNDYRLEADFYHYITIYEYSGGYSWYLKRSNFDYDFLEEKHHIPLLARYKMLKENQHVEASETYLEYLASVNIISSYSYQTYLALKEAKRKEAENASIITAISIRETSLSLDKGVDYTCIDTTPARDEFKVGSTYKYGQYEDEKSWSGEAAMSNMLSIIDGSSLGQQKICSYAKFENHPWVGYPKYAGLIDKGCCFFGLYFK